MSKLIGAIKATEAQPPPPILKKGRQNLEMREREASNF